MLHIPPIRIDSQVFILNLFKRFVDVCSLCSKKCHRSLIKLPKRTHNNDCVTLLLQLHCLDNFLQL